MEFTFNVNEFLCSKVTMISSKGNYLMVYTLSEDIHHCQDKDCSTVRLDLEGEDPVRIWRKTQSGLSYIIDIMGERSATAQGLRFPITSTPKLLRSDQRLYTLKDANANNGFGVVIGILKVGVKKLFMADENRALNEVHPISVLDFYVHESKQRQGYGHDLFEVMLKVEKVSPVELAIDQPSADLLQFLKKHYGLHSAVIQANNFAIFPGFFHKVKVTSPPIYLYHGKEGTNEAYGMKTNRLHNLPTKKCTYITDEKDSLQEFPIYPNYRYQKYVPVSSSAKGCLQWNNSPLEKSYYSRHCRSQPIQNVHLKCPNKPIPSMKLEHEGCREVNSQSLLFTDKIHEAATPVKQATHAQRYSAAIDISVDRKSRRKWNDMLSSWNVMGVLPQDFSYIRDNQHYDSFRQEFINSRP